MLIDHSDQWLERWDKLFNARKYEYKSSSDWEFTENLMGSGGLFWLGRDSSGFGLLIFDSALPG